MEAVELKNKIQIAAYHRVTTHGGGRQHIPAHRQVLALSSSHLIFTDHAMGNESTSCAH